MNTSMHLLRHARRPHFAHLVKQAGFTLIEMMIAVTIGLGILAGLVGVLATNASNARSNDRTSELMTNGRYALNSIKQEMRQAGFRGYTYAEQPWPSGALGAINNECLEAGAADGTFVANIRQAVWGFNGAAGVANPFEASCIPAPRYLAGNDILVVRRLGVIPETAAALAASNANSFHFWSTFERGRVFRGITAPTFPGASLPRDSFALHTHVYYISPFTVSAAEVPLVPALFRVALQTDGTMARELVASGIEHMQVQYGRRDPAANSTQYLNSGAAPLDATSFVPSLTVGTDPTGWDQVNSVRIWLLARNATVESGYANTTTYTMGGQDFAKNDNFRRQLFTTVVQLRNDLSN